MYTSEWKRHQWKTSSYKVVRYTSLLVFLSQIWKIYIQPLSFTHAHAHIYFLLPREREREREKSGKFPRTLTSIWLLHLSLDRGTTRFHHPVELIRVIQTKRHSSSSFTSVEGETAVIGGMRQMHKQRCLSIDRVDFYRIKLIFMDALLLIESIKYRIRLEISMCWLEDFFVVTLIKGRRG